MWSYTHTDELYHYGIPGMKWGIRRYQNSDGTLNDLGKKRNRNNKVDDKIAKKLSKKFDKLVNKKNTASYKAYEDFSRAANKSKAMKAFQKYDDHVHKTGFIDIGKYNALQKNAINEANRIKKEHKKYMAEALIKDCGYEHTEKGRKYITAIMDKYADKHN